MSWKKMTSRMTNEGSSLVIEMKYHFDGNIDDLLDAIRKGRAFSINGRALPISEAFRSGPLLFVKFPHRTLQIDLTKTLIKFKKYGPIDIFMKFEK